LQSLTNNFHPQGSGKYPGSGLGVLTLTPIYELLVTLKDRHKSKTDKDYDAADEKLGNLIHQALQDESNDKWVTYSGQVERLVTELHLAFHWREDLSLTKLLPHARGQRGSPQPKRRSKTAKTR
jgi:hypothetical protein